MNVTILLYYLANDEEWFIRQAIIQVFSSVQKPKIFSASLISITTWPFFLVQQIYTFLGSC